MKRYTRDVILLFVLLLLIGVFLYRLFWPQISLVVTPDFIKSDSWHFGISGKYLLKQMLDQGKFPIWTDKLSFGFPVLGEGQTGLFFLPNIFFLHFFSFALGYNLLYVLAFLTLGSGLYVWLRCIGYRPLPSWFGAVTLTFSGIAIPRMTQLAVLQGLSFLPWLMFVTLLIYRKQSLLSMAIFSLIASQQLLTGFTQTSVVSFLFSGSYLLWLMRSRLLDIKRLIFYSCAVILTIGLSAIHILPAQEFIKQTSVVNGLVLSEATRFSFAPNKLLTFIQPFWFGNPQNGTYPPLEDVDENIFWENSVYIGLLPVFLLGWLFYSRKQMRKDEVQFTLFLFVTTLIAFLLILGKSSPLYLIYSHWPLNQFRVPARFNWVFVVVIIIMGVQGLQLFLRQKNTNRLTRLVLCSLLAFHVTSLLWVWWNYHLLGDAGQWLNPPVIANTLSTNTRIAPLFFEEDYNREFNKGWVDPRPHEFLKNSLTPNSNLIWNIQSSGITGGRFLRRPSFVDQLLREAFTISGTEASSSATAEKLLNLLSVNQVLTPMPIIHTNLRQVASVQSGNLAIYKYENTQTLPRVYLSSSPKLVSTLEEAEATFKSESFIPGRDVLVEESLAIPNNKTFGKAEIIFNSDTRVVVKVTDNPDKAILVLADTYYPGWMVTIDGKETKILPANIRQRAVVVPAGVHTVEFVYKPQAFTLGIKISAFSTFLVLLILVREIINYVKRNRKTE